MWEKRISHEGLNAYRVVRGQTQLDVELKAQSQESIWAERWRRKVEADHMREAKAQLLERRSASVASVATARSLALEQTRELEEDREILETLLHAALLTDPRPDWEKKKDRSKFSIPMPAAPNLLPLPIAPDATDPAFNPTPIVPKLDLLDRVLTKRRESKLRIAAESNEQAQRNADAQYEEAVADWKSRTVRIEASNAAAIFHDEEAAEKWKEKRAAFNAEIASQHKFIDELRVRYLAGEPEAIIMYIEDVLGQSSYPEEFPKEFNFEYEAKTKTLVIDYELPSQTALPTIKEVKFVATRSEFQKVPVSDVWVRKTYDEILYQISLRTLYELFESDDADVLVSIVFNGWVRSIDRATGSEVHACVMSLEARKDEFLAINLNHVDCKACFKKLKGVSASKLIELSPIKPLVLLNKEDKRFVEGYGVVDSIDDHTNLAAMDWLDFENLIREVFEKEFSKGGGEVKITQASRDGGVDAIAFDPDPIRGGKLVIQAKRYTNTVGVSAVRDLYGTVHNEGANKGILVTTSDFGPDAYAFAKDKPLTLISGGQLLHLLGQHGHTAKIDLAEAKRIAAENPR